MYSAPPHAVRCAIARWLVSTQSSQRPTVAQPLRRRHHSAETFQHCNRTPKQHPQPAPFPFYSASVPQLPLPPLCSVRPARLAEPQQSGSGHSSEHSGCSGHVQRPSLGREEGAAGTGGACHVAHDVVHHSLRLRRPSRASLREQSGAIVGAHFEGSHPRRAAVADDGHRRQTSSHTGHDLSELGIQASAGAVLHVHSATEGSGRLRGRRRSAHSPAKLSAGRRARCVGPRGCAGRQCSCGWRRWADGEWGMENEQRPSLIFSEQRSGCSCFRGSVEVRRLRVRCYRSRFSLSLSLCLSLLSLHSTLTALEQRLSASIACRVSLYPLASACACHSVQLSAAPCPASLRSLRSVPAARLVHCERVWSIAHVLCLRASSNRWTVARVEEGHDATATATIQAVASRASSQPFD